MCISNLQAGAWLAEEELDRLTNFIVVGLYVLGLGGWLYYEAYQARDATRGVGEEEDFRTLPLWRTCTS